MDVTYARWRPSALAPLAHMRLQLRSSCWMDVWWARWGPSNWTPTGPISLLPRRSCWRDMRCARWGPSALAPFAHIRLPSRHSCWMQESLSSWEPRAAAAWDDIACLSIPLLHVRKEVMRESAGHRAFANGAYSRSDARTQTDLSASMVDTPHV